MQLILCFQQTSELDKLTASWGKVIWLCCAGLHVAADAGSAPCHKSVCFNLGEDLLSPTGSINLGFLLRETCYCLHHTFLLGFPNKSSIITFLGTASVFLAPLPGRGSPSSSPLSTDIFWCRDFYKGSPSLPTSLLCFCFA